MDWVGLAQNMGTGDEILWMQQSAFGFHKMRGISWLADDLESVLFLGVILGYRVNQCHTIFKFRPSLRTTLADQPSELDKTFHAFFKPSA